MYHYDLRIKVHGLEDGVVEALKKLAPEKNLTYNFAKVETLDKAELAKSNVYIYKGGLDGETLNIFKTVKEKAEVYLILCVKEENLTTSEIDLAEEIWPEHVSVDRYVALFEKTMSRLKIIMDGELSASYLDSLIDNMPGMVWFKDTKGIHLKVNKKFCEVVAKTKEEIQGRDHCYIWNITPEEYAEGEYVCMETEEPVLKEGKSAMFEETVKYGDTLHYLNTYKSPIFDHNHKVIGTVGFARDTTDVWTSRRELKLVLNNLPSPCLLYDENMLVTAANTAYCENFGCEETDILGKRGLLDKSEVFPGAILKNRVDLRPNLAQYDFEGIVDGKKLVYRGMAHTLSDTKGKRQGLLMVLTDFSKEKQVFEKIYNMSVTDALTGCYNRTYYREKLEKLVGEKRGFAFGLVDLDRLKRVNDRFGHEAGDAYIVSAIAVLTKLLPQEVEIFRIGGDEFALVAETFREEELQTKITQAEEEFKKMKRPYTPSFSYGTGYIKVDSFQDFRKEAAQVDAKLYRMKQHR